MVSSHLESLGPKCEWPATHSEPPPHVAPLSPQNLTHQITRIFSFIIDLVWKLGVTVYLGHLRYLSAHFIIMAKFIIKMLSQVILN